MLTKHLTSNLGMGRFILTLRLREKSVMNDREGVADGIQAESPLLGVLVTLFK